MSYSNSSLVSYIIKSPNHSGQRMHKIDRITVHCVVGQMTAQNLGKYFSKSTTQASCNYGIGKDGDIVLCVDESNRSWCSSSYANDQRAITIECASDKLEPYAFNDAVYNRLVDLCIDICKRNGIKKVLWLGTKEKSLAYEPKEGECVLTAHRWFAKKSCPGDWMYSREQDLANKINAAIATKSSDSSLPKTPFVVKVLVFDLNIRSLPSMAGTIKGQTGKGSFTITETKDGWGKLKSGQGWIYLENKKYVEVCGNSSQVTQTSSTRRINAAILNIRKGPGTNYDVIGQIRDRGIYTIVKEQDGWGLLKSGQGWISLSYTILIK